MRALDAPPVMLHARWDATKHLIRFLFIPGHRIWRLEVWKPGRWWRWTEAVYCECGKDFH